MFRTNYQGGAVVEVFSGQGKDPVAKWKLCGGPSDIYKEYSREVKGFVYCLEGRSRPVKMQMPENEKSSLGLLQRFLVLQVNIPQFKDFSVELMITDLHHLKRRLHLSTVHKELSATLLHARIPFAGLKRSIWSNLCIDLESFSGELFKGFLTLDAITLFATCKVRRIFTMKSEPTGVSNDDMFLGGARIMDLTPRSCHFHPDVNHVTQVLNMENLLKACMSSDCVPDHSTTASSTSFPQSKPHGVLHTASGSRLSGPTTRTGRRSSAASDRMDRMRSPSKRMNQKGLHAGSLGSLQPHPPKDTVFDKQRSEKLRVCSTGRQRLVSSATPDAVSGGQKKRSNTREKHSPPSCRKESKHQPLTQTEKTNHPTADLYSCTPARQSSRAAPRPAEPLRSGFSSDLQDGSSWESNEGPEPRLSLQGEVFTFSSQPHSPRRGHGQGEQEKMEVADDQVQNGNGRRHEAQLDDDFIGSESDEFARGLKPVAEWDAQGPRGRENEDNSYNTFNPVTPRSPSPTSNGKLEVHPEAHRVVQTPPKELSPSTAGLQAPSSVRAEAGGIAPTRCLSPGATPGRQEVEPASRRSEVLSQVVDVNSSLSLLRRLLQEVKLDDSTQHKSIVSKVRDSDQLKPVDFGDHESHVVSRPRTRGDDQHELRMLASLKREQEEYECGASGLSASQIHHCNVSISMSSDDASTWTHVSTPANQGHHYQKEMNPLLQSNPREWTDVLSPPIMPAGQRRRSDNTWNHLEDLIGGREESVNEEEKEEEYLNLLYDPCLNCYFDPETGKYYELA
ncbi:protein CFAP20DC isoform 2-T2 [Spinachia spinachia]